MKPLNVLPKFENHFAIRAVRFQVQLEAGGYFSLRRFLRLHPQQAGIQHKNTLVPHLNGRWISKFLGEKFVFEESALIRSILHQTGTITSGFEGKKRKYHFLKNRAILWYALSRAVHKNRTSQVRFSPSKPDLIRPKNTYLIVIGFLQAFIEPWEPNDRLHGIPGHDPARESRKTPLEGAGNSCRENGISNLKSRRYAKTEPVVPISLLNSLQNPQKPELPVPKNKIYDVIH